MSPAPSTPDASPRSRRALTGLNFFVADVQDGLGPFLGVQLQALGWQAGAIGLAMTAGGMAGLLGTVPAGALVDATRRKRAVVALACLLTVASSCLVLASHAFPVVLASQVASGLCGALIGPALTGLTLGLVRQAGFERQMARNQVANHAGNVVAAAAAGYLGWKFGLVAVFALLGGFALLATASLWRIDPRQIDHQAARGSEPDGETAQSAQAVRWRDLLRQRPLLLLGMALLFFHLGNAAMLPLYGQAAVATHAANPAVFTAATVIIAQLVMVLAALAAMRLLPRYGHWWVLLMTFVALPLRGVVAAGTLGSLWGVLPVQALDGIGAGLQSVAVPATVASLMRGTGRTNAAQGLVMTLQGVGAALSPAVGGWIAQHWSYRAAFLALGSVAVLSLIPWLLHGRKTAAGDAIA